MLVGAAFCSGCACPVDAGRMETISNPSDSIDGGASGSRWVAGAGIGGRLSLISTVTATCDSESVSQWVCAFVVDSICLHLPWPGP